MKRERYKDDRGRMGTLVNTSGFTQVKLDNGNLVPFKADRWELVVDHSPWSPITCARIAYAADIELCRALGMHREAAKSWDRLTDRDRILFKEHGPGDPMIRKVIFDANMRAMEPLTK